VNKKERVGSNINFQIPKGIKGRGMCKKERDRERSRAALLFENIGGVRWVKEDGGKAGETKF